MRREEMRREENKPITPYPMQPPKFSPLPTTPLLSPLFPSNYPILNPNSKIMLNHSQSLNNSPDLHLHLQLLSFCLTQSLMLKPLVKNPH